MYTDWLLRELLLRESLLRELLLRELLQCNVGDAASQPSCT
jgi:hypothetical protein